MKHLIVTFKENGVDKISDYSGSQKSTKEITTLLHNSSYYANLVKALRSETNNKNLEEMSVISLGYALEQVVKAKVYSTISNIEFHDLPLSKFGVKFK